MLSAVVADYSRAGTCFALEKRYFAFAWERVVVAKGHWTKPSELKKKNPNAEIFFGLSNLFIIILIRKDNRQTRFGNSLVKFDNGHGGGEHEKFSHNDKKK